MMIILSVLAIVTVALILVGGYTIWHATAYGEGRRLDFFLFGESMPPATVEEECDWLRRL